jgi:hypothetical protein
MAAALPDATETAVPAPSTPPIAISVNMYALKDLERTAAHSDDIV